MDLSKLRTQLIKHEGVSLTAYTDSVGKTTIGVGHNVSDKPITMVAAMGILDDDIKDTIAFLQANCPWWGSLDEVRQRAICDLTFDLMGKVLDFHNMIVAIKAGDWNTASAELLNSTFAHQAPNRAKDLATQLLTGKD